MLCSLLKFLITRVGRYYILLALSKNQKPESKLFVDYFQERETRQIVSKRVAKLKEIYMNAEDMFH